jgi:hypothetical protein
VFFVLFVFVLCLVYPILSASLDCSFLIAMSVFSKIYLLIRCIVCRCVNVIIIPEILFA